MSPSTEPLDFDRDIKPLFREKDQRSMAAQFDLWSADDVARHAGPILNLLRAGTMPCDGAWPEDQIDLLQRWVDQRATA